MFHIEVYNTNSLDLFSALCHLTYENEFEPNFKSKINVTKSDPQEIEFIQMFDFQHIHLTPENDEKILTIIQRYRNVYATTEFYVAETKLKLNLSWKKDKVFRKQLNSKIPF